jgi:lycopene beta-cyclase
MYLITIYYAAHRIRQRAFFTFGMDVLLTLNLTETRQFFTAFFALSDHHWQVTTPALTLC